LPQLMARDRHDVQQLLFQLKSGKSRRQSRQLIQRKLDIIEKKIALSIKKAASRKKHMPQPAYNTDLPIFKHKEEIISSIKANPVIIVSGDTGSGKTTQIPQFCIEAERGIDGIIGCTQPRRIAVTSVAHRIADELGTSLGESVGYKMRFKEKTGKHTVIKLMTDGILLAETQSDRFLYAYDTLIVDEAHERSLNIDFILGILKNLILIRKDLKVIVTSATIDTEKFSAAFGNAPVIEVSGRMYPVDIHYLSPPKKGENSLESTHIEMAVEAVEAVRKKNTRGDILLFMPTEQDIRDTCELIAAKPFHKDKTLPLYARLSASEQRRIFKKERGRKIIVATNVAETSITIPNIKYVIDTGLARISHYSPTSGTTSLPVVPVSRSSVDQRKGRCGRVQNGVCFRLFSKNDYISRPMYTSPEIVRANLAEVILRMIALDIGEIEKFPFIDPPTPKRIKGGYDLLFELGAITKKPDAKKFTLTARGRLMSKMPIDPRLSRMLIEADRQGCRQEMLVIASALSIQDPRERPVEKADQADQVHTQFLHVASDFMSLLNMWQRFQKLKQEKKSTNPIKKFCKTHFLSFIRMREWQDIHDQLKNILKESGLSSLKNKRQNRSFSNAQFPDAAYNSIHLCILSGFLSNIAVKKEKNIFNAGKGQQVMIFPGSALFNRAGKWIVSAEIVKTSRQFARTVANIDPAWLEEIGGKQCKRNYFDPHWSKSRGEVMVFEQTSLYGLIIEPRRSVVYGKINPVESLDLFIQGALLEHRVKSKLSFMVHNKAVIDDIKNIENRLRKRDLLMSEAEMKTIYQQRLPYIYSIRSLEQLIRKKGSDDFLKMKKEDLLNYEPNRETIACFPETMLIFDHQFKCSYQFNPGESDDGVTIHIPATMMSSIPKELLEWLVPGLLEEKITFLTKGLKRVYRKQLAPLSATIKTIVMDMGVSKSSLIAALGNFINNQFKVAIPPDAWPLISLPPHLKMRVAVTGHDGTTICSGREPDIFFDKRIAEYAQRDFPEFVSLKKAYELSDIKQWDFGDLPNAILLNGKGGATYMAFPALKQNQKTRRVDLRLFHNHGAARAVHSEGVLALFSIHFSKELQYLKRHIRLNKELADHADYFGGGPRLADWVFRKILRTLFKKDIRSRQSFYSYAKHVGASIQSRGQQILDRIIPVLKANHELRSTLSRLEHANKFNQGIQIFLKSIRKELSDLLPETFMDLYDVERCQQLPRYLKAIAFRAERGVVDPAKDTIRSKKVEKYTTSLDQLIRGLSPSVSHEKQKAIEAFFWIIQEYKVSLFAQELKTPFSVSPEKLEKALKKIQAMK
jgi:ATP-dependent helicase HrpA